MRAAVVVFAALLPATGCDVPPTQPKANTSQPDAPDPRAPVPATPPLKVGDLLPPLTTKGWINGPPPTLGAQGQKLLVVDIWAHWCPHCRHTVPNLIRLRDKYSPSGVRFVGLTNMPEEMAAAYVLQNRIPWPNGYELSPDLIVRFGAGSGMTAPWHQLAPTIYVAGPDGVIRWTDDRRRLRHPDPLEWERLVDAGIATALEPPALVGP